MTSTRTLVLSAFVSLVSFSFAPHVSFAHVLTPSTVLAGSTNNTYTRDKDARCPTLQKPNLDIQDGFNEEAHKRKLRQIKRQNKAAKKPIPTQKHNL